MAHVLAEWANFEGGHWGSLGPLHAPNNTYGGTNMLLNRQGGVATASASRALTLSNATSGKVWAMFWAWGLDGRIYYVQQDAATTYSIKAFTPDPGSVPLSVTTLTGTLTGPLVYEPDAVSINTSMYLTVWGDKTYTVTPAGDTFTKLTGTGGDAPAGRCIALYGERVVIGGISDNRLGVHPNRIHYSGFNGTDVLDPDPTDKTYWEALNFFDVGADDTFVTGLYPIKDGLIVVLSDQQIWTVSGVPGVNGSLRRAYGFHKGISAVTSFSPNHAVVDPSQTRLWMFDHTYRGIARFNGGAYERITSFGAPRRDRTGSDLVEGATTGIGGPDEFLFHGVAMPRAAGSTVINENLELIRVNKAFNIVQRDVLAGT